MHHLLLWYLDGRGSITCLESTTELELPPIMQELAISQDIIGWDRFMMGMVLRQFVNFQSANLLRCNTSQSTSWIVGLITQLLQVTHSQWIYRCIIVHDRTTGMLTISAHKEDLLREIEHQLTLGPDGLAEEDRFLLEWNFDELARMNGEHQEY